MIIGINYTNNDRCIAMVQYVKEYSNEKIASIAQNMKGLYDEIYVVNFNSNYKDLIDEIVLKGCRV